MGYRHLRPVAARMWIKHFSIGRPPKMAALQQRVIRRRQLMAQFNLKMRDIDNRGASLGESIKSFAFDMGERSVCKGLEVAR